jgi:hypothetical protein
MTVIVMFMVGLFTGCNTPGSRIKKKQAVFDTYPADVQERLRRGEVNVGDTADMVYIAQGNPDHKYNRQTAAGKSEIWSYTGIYKTPNRQRVEGNFRYRDADGQWRTASDYIWIDVDVQHEYEKKRIEFQQGFVTAIEDIEQ